MLNVNKELPLKNGVVTEINVLWNLLSWIIETLRMQKYSVPRKNSQENLMWKLFWKSLKCKQKNSINLKTWQNFKGRIKFCLSVFIFVFKANHKFSISSLHVSYRCFWEFAKIFHGFCFHDRFSYVETQTLHKKFSFKIHEQNCKSLKLMCDDFKHLMKLILLFNDANSSPGNMEWMEIMVFFVDLKS